MDESKIKEVLSRTDSSKYQRSADDIDLICKMLESGASQRDAANAVPGLSEQLLSQWIKRARAGDHGEDGLLAPLVEVVKSLDVKEFFVANRLKVEKALLDSAINSRHVRTITYHKITRVTKSVLDGLNELDKSKIAEWFDDKESVVFKTQVSVKEVAPSVSAQEKIIKQILKDTGDDLPNDLTELTDDIPMDFYTEQDGKLFLKVLYTDNGRYIHADKKTDLTKKEIGLLYLGKITTGVRRSLSTSLS